MVPSLAWSFVLAPQEEWELVDLSSPGEELAVLAAMALEEPMPHVPLRVVSVSPVAQPRVTVVVAQEVSPATLVLLLLEAQALLVRSSSRSSWLS